MRYYVEETKNAYESFWWLSDHLAPRWRKNRPLLQVIGKNSKKIMMYIGFTSRIEEPIVVNEEFGYIGVAEFDLNALPLAVEMMRSSSETGCIVFKEKRENEASEEIMQLALAHEFEIGPLLSFSNLIPALASHHYHTCLWKLYSTEEELCCFYRTTD